MVSLLISYVFDNRPSCHAKNFRFGNDSWIQQLEFALNALIILAMLIVEGIETYKCM
jgi:hypothetical protein